MSRVKKVFTDTDEIAHLWAHQTQDEARNPAYNFYFSGRSIYSYGSHFEMARIIADGVCFVTTASYSNTTAKHMGSVRRAIPYDWTVFYLPNFHGIPEKKATINLVPINKNIEHFASEIEELVKKQAKARKVDYTGQIKSLSGQLKKYVEYFKFQKYVPKYYKFMLDLEDKSTEELAEAFGMVHNKKLKERKAKERKLKKEQALKIEEWKEGSHDKGAISHLMQDEILLRLVEREIAEAGTEPDDVKTITAQYVQTSKAVEVSATDARKLYAVVRRVRQGKLNEEKATELMEQEGVKIISNWDINRITEDGGIIAGCHRIQWTEIQRFATKYGW